MTVRMLAAAIEELPPSLRQRVLDYGAYVNAAAGEIFASAGAEQVTREAVDRLVLVAGLRKLWSMVEFQHATITAITGQSWLDINGVISRGTVLSRSSEEAEIVKAMRDDLQRSLEESEVMHLVRMRTLVEIAQELR